MLRGTPQESAGVPPNRRASVPLRVLPCPFSATGLDHGSIVDWATAPVTVLAFRPRQLGSELGRAAGSMQSARVAGALRSNRPAVPQTRRSFPPYLGA